MKILGEVLAVETIGDHLRVRLQGKAIGAAAWQPLGVISVDVPPSTKNQKSFYVGRQVKVTLAPV